MSLDHTHVMCKSKTVTMTKACSVYPQSLLELPYKRLLSIASSYRTRGRKLFPVYISSVLTRELPITSLYLRTASRKRDNRTIGRPREKCDR